jgi:hypothetical protein
MHNQTNISRTIARKRTGRAGLEPPSHHISLAWQVASAAGNAAWSVGSAVLSAGSATFQAIGSTRATLLTTLLGFTQKTTALAATYNQDACELFLNGTIGVCRIGDMVEPTSIRSFIQTVAIQLQNNYSVINECYLNGTFAGPGEEVLQALLTLGGFVNSTDNIPACPAGNSTFVPTAAPAAPDSSNLGLIIGAAVAGVLTVTTIAAVCACLQRRQRAAARAPVVAQLPVVAVEHIELANSASLPPPSSSAVPSSSLAGFSSLFSNRSSAGVSGAVSSRLPRSAASSAPVSRPIQIRGDWEMRTDNEGQTYYWNKVTNVAAWDPPSDFYSH